MFRPADDITALATRWADGDEAAFHALVERVYDELRVMARKQLRESPERSAVSTTVLVHEAYLRLAQVEGGTWPSRSHFFALCAKVMRFVLVDLARRKSAARRGGGQIHITLDDMSGSVESDALELLALDEAVGRIAARSPRMGDVIECRLFGGMSVAETAEALTLSTRTVEREWSRARAYLQHTLGPP